MGIWFQSKLKMANLKKQSFLFLMVMLLGFGTLKSRDVIKARLAKCQRLRRRRMKRNPFPWEARKFPHRPSYMDPVGFLASPFTPGTDTDLYRWPGRRYSPYTGGLLTDQQHWLKR